MEVTLFTRLFLTFSVIESGMQDYSQLDLHRLLKVLSLLLLCFASSHANITVPQEMFWELCTTRVQL